jgi:hypothetical protein
MMDPRDMFNGRNNDGWEIIISEASFLHFIPGKSKLIIHQDLGCKFALLVPQELVLEDSDVGNNASHCVIWHFSLGCTWHELAAPLWVLSAAIPI